MEMLVRYAFVYKICSLNVY